MNIQIKKGVTNQMRDKRNEAKYERGGEAMRQYQEERGEVHSIRMNVLDLNVPLQLLQNDTRAPAYKENRVIWLRVY